MTTIRLTSKLSKKINVVPETTLPLEANPFTDWTARLLTANRVQYILITNTSSLYSTVMFGKGITDLTKFMRQFDHSIKDQLLTDNLQFHYEKFIAPDCGQVSFSKSLNQSVTGSMNDIVKHVKFYVEEWDLSLTEISKRISELPMKSLDYEVPVDVFRKMKRQ